MAISCRCNDSAPWIVPILANFRQVFTPTEWPVPTAVYSQQHISFRLVGTIKVGKGSALAGVLYWSLLETLHAWVLPSARHPASCFLIENTPSSKSISFIKFLYPHLCSHLGNDTSKIPMKKWKWIKNFMKWNKSWEDIKKTSHR